jgi:hypothetical protein
MGQPQPPILQMWPYDCHPVRFLLRPVSFGDVEEFAPGLIQRAGTYSNPATAWAAPQEFPLKAVTSVDARKQLLEFTDRLRAWIEAVPATKELAAAIDEIGAPPEPSPSEPEWPEDAITLDIGSLIDQRDPAIVFSIIDPQLDVVGPSNTHKYSRPSNGMAQITVESGDCQLQGVNGGPYRRRGGQSTPQVGAGRHCSVYGFERSWYWIGSAWQD